MKPIDMKAAKERLEQKRRYEMVLSAFDKLSRDDDRKILQQRAEIEKKARKRL